jgi:hypothetical protein
MRMVNFYCRTMSMHLPTKRKQGIDLSTELSAYEARNLCCACLRISAEADFMGEHPPFKNDLVDSEKCVVTKDGEK